MVLCCLQISWKVACVILTCSDGSSFCIWNTLFCHQQSFLSSTQSASLSISASCVFKAQEKSLSEAASQTQTSCLTQPCLLFVLCSFCSCSLQLRAKLGWQQLLKTHSHSCLGDTGTKLYCSKAIPPSAPQHTLWSPGDEPHGAETCQPMTASGIGVSYSKGTWSWYRKKKMLRFWPQPVKGSDLELNSSHHPLVQRGSSLRALSWALSCPGPGMNTQGHRDPTAMNTQFQGKFPHMEINIKVEVVCLLKPGWDSEAQQSLSSFTLSHRLFVSFWPVTFVTGTSIYSPIRGPCFLWWIIYLPQDDTGLLQGLLLLRLNQSQSHQFWKMTLPLVLLWARHWLLTLLIVCVSYVSPLFQMKYGTT